MTNTLDQILLERACRYGNFDDVAKRTTYIYHHMVFGAPQFNSKADMSIYYEALRMIALKVARLVNGRIDDLDGWRDIAGYAMLVHNQIAREEEAKAAKSAFSDDKAMSDMEAKITAEMKQAEEA